MKYMMNPFQPIYYAPAGDGGASANEADAEPEPEETPPGDGTETEPEGEPQDFDTWLSTQDEQVKARINNHLSGLSNALKAERGERKNLARQLRDVTGKLEEGSELKGQLDKVSADFDALERQASFYEDAHAAGVSNLRLAWLAAQDAGLINKSGDVDLDKLKAQAPELFRKPTIPAGNAGNGRVHVPQAEDMNTIIRRAAGRTT